MKKLHGNTRSNPRKAENCKSSALSYESDNIDKKHNEVVNSRPSKRRRCDEKTVLSPWEPRHAEESSWWEIRSHPTMTPQHATVSCILHYQLQLKHLRSHSLNFLEKS